jgi:hypothetical protein
MSPAEARQRAIKLDGERHTIKVDFAVKIGVVKGLHRNFLLVMVTSLELRIFNGDVLLNVLAGKSDLVILALAKHAHESPIGDRDGNTKKGGKEEICFEATAVNEREDAFE